jgi:ABC-type multidrug transport system ATPase subunit
VSGGERKRANIGTQMIFRPAILFLDEPTSGLDAFQSQSVMECMKVR